MKLKREISKINLLFLSISSIIGSGWLFGSYYTAQIAGPLAILSWFLGGLFISIIGLTLAELSTMIPLSGGSINYATLSHGKFCGGLFSWITWLWSMAVAPIEVQAIIQYASHYVPHILSPATSELTHFGIFFAAILMLLLCFINLAGVKLMSDANKLISIWKIGIPIAISIIFLTYKPHYENLTSHGFAPFGIEGLFSSISTGGVALSFFGFQTGIFLAGEAKNPQKSIPFALFGSLFLCVFIYALLQIGFIVGVNPAALQAGWDQLSFLGDSGPIAGILLAFGLLFIAKLLYIDAILSPFGTAISYVAASSRILYSIGIQSGAPKSVTKLNKNSIPWMSILINFFFGMLFFLPFSGWKQMASFLSAAIVVSLVCGPITLPIFREHLSDKKRPFKLPHYKLISFVSLYLCTLILYWTGFDTVLKFEICCSILIALFFTIYALNKKLRAIKFNFLSSAWLIFYLVLCGMLSYSGTFGGGKNLITIPESLFLILLISIITFYFSQKTALSKSEIRSSYNKLMLGHNEIIDDNEKELSKFNQKVLAK